MKKFLRFIKLNWKSLVILIFMVFTTYELTQINKRIRSIESDISSIESNVSSIESDVSVIQSNVSSIESDVSSMAIKIGY
jgi:peptidoglycan hydrolase CwlO-like protein